MFFFCVSTSSAEFSTKYLASYTLLHFGGSIWIRYHLTSRLQRNRCCCVFKFLIWWFSILYRLFVHFQISTRTQNYIVDTLALRSELWVLNEVFTNPHIVKVLHGADQDILWLQRDFGLYIVNMFDTGIFELWSCPVVVFTLMWTAWFLLVRVLRLYLFRYFIQAAAAKFWVTI